MVHGRSFPIQPAERNFSIAATPSRPAVGTMERPDCATYTTPITSLLTFLTQTGIESKSCATHLNCLGPE